MEEKTHFELPSFRVNIKIFATLVVNKNRTCLLLPKMDQSVYGAMADSGIYPVPNKWGQKGAGFVDLAKVGKVLLSEILLQAYNRVNRKK